MPEISGLYVKIGADSSDLDRGMANAKRSVDNFSSTMANAAKTALSYFAVFKATTALKDFITDSMNAIDATSKLARELGTSTESLGTLNRAASYAGVSTEELTAHLRIMNRTIGDGIAGNEQARKVFDKLGLSLVDIAQMNVDQRMIAIGNALRTLGSNAERASALTDLFGRGGMKMSELIMGGAEAMKQAADEAKNLGLAISAIDARQVEQANDAWKRAEGAVDGLGNIIAVKLSPFLDMLAQKLTLTSNNAQAVGKVMDGVFSTMAGVIATVGAAVDGLKLAFTGLAAIISGILLGLAHMQDIGAKIFQGLGNVAISQINGIKSVWNDFISATQALPGWLGGGLSDSLKIGLTDPLKFAADASEKVQANLDQIMESFGEQMTGFESLGSRAQRIAEGFVKAEEASRNAAVAAENANKEMLGGGVPTLQETDAERAAAEKAAKELEQYRKTLNDKLTTLMEANATEEEIEIAKMAAQQKILDDALAAKLISQEDYLDTLESLQFEHVAAMQAIQNQSLTDQEKWEKMSWQEKTKTVVNATANMTAAVANSSKSMFALNKAASIANAIINTAEAVTKNHAAYPEPIGSIMAGIAAAAGMAQIAAIRATTFGGGGSGAASTAAPSVPATSGASSTASGGGASADKGAFVQINLQGGNLYSADQIRGLIGAINDQIDSGAQIRGVQIA